MFQERLAECTAAVQERLSATLSDYPESSITEAMRYAVVGGKGFRGFLVMESARLHGIGADVSVWSAAAIEAIHAYSLVHDDLPCMDDDDLRRGRPTVHVKWNEATAVLVGDALQTLAFELLSRPEAGPVQATNVMLHSLARAAGGRGMVNGQALDIAAETAGRMLTLQEITALQANKTGALIGWAATAGPRLAAANIAPMADYSTALGLAFQIADDILDVEGDSAKTGKRVGKDADAGKATFVTLLGLDGAKALAKDLVAEAEAALEPYGDNAQALRQAARFVISREM